MQEQDSAWYARLIVISTDDEQLEVDAYDALQESYPPLLRHWAQELNRQGADLVKYGPGVRGRLVGLLMEALSGVLMGAAAPDGNLNMEDFASDVASAQTILAVLLHTRGCDREALNASFLAAREALSSRVAIAASCRMINADDDQEGVSDDV